jgi:hypothetical protein
MMLEGTCSLVQTAEGRNVMSSLGSKKLSARLAGGDEEYSVENPGHVYTVRRYTGYIVC